MKGIRKFKSDLLLYISYLNSLDPSENYDKENVNSIRLEKQSYLNLGSILESYKKGFDRETVMLRIAEFSHIPKLIELFIKHGANLDVVDEGQRTPLIIAIQNSSKPDLENIKLLASKSTNVDAKDKWGRTALFFACSSWTKANKEHIEVLISSGANPNIIGEDHMVNKVRKATPFIKSIEKDDVTIVKMLLNAGAKVGVNDHFYCRNEPEILKLLLNNGCNINAENKEGKTLFFQKIERPYIKPMEFLKVFLSAGVNINEQDQDGKTVLFGLTEGFPYVSEEDNRVVFTVLESGIDVNIKDKYGRTAFIEMFDSSDTGRVEKKLQLLEYMISNTDIDLNAEDNVGRNILYAPIFRGQMYTVKYLLQLGARLNKNLVLPRLKTYYSDMTDSIRDTDYSYVSKSDFPSSSPNYLKSNLESMYHFLKSY